ncbi:DUF6962 family protein [Pseudodonghicola flavimaris]|uniref:DUF998 domain-containing protein n=1 Tax=Pseudodonghicola flavimaris TaxID=3050036 RepID=A0ABT7EY75_9RHOB|nr:hypothetical protein [Pseudodonghicola flavimaris]MDK3017288.1 hypothetical protein [Pseudodonghicola flavimaris]
MLSELALSALTDGILACELFFLAGLSFRPGVQAGSPAWLWGATLALIGLASLLGMIDHGFYEAIGHPAHRSWVVATRVVIVAGSLAMIVTAAAQYLAGRWRGMVMGAAALGALYPLGMILTSDDFMSVILYYSAGLLLLLGLSVANLRQNSGTWAMILGILVTLGISGMIPAQSSGFWGLGLYGSYHVLLMPTVILLYLGGCGFRRGRGAARS